MLRDIVEALVTHPKTIFSIFFVLFAVLGFTAVNLAIEPDFSALIRDDGTYNTNARIIENIYAENNGVALYYSIKERSIVDNRVTQINQEEFSEYAETLTEALQGSQYVTSVSPPRYADNGRAATIGVGLYVPNEANAFKPVQEELNAYLEEVPSPRGTDVIITGLPTLLDRTATLLITDNLKTMLITVSLVLLVLYAYFRDVRLALIGIATPLFSIVCLAAIMVFLDIPVTLTLAAVGVLIIGLGADYSIHITIAFERFLKKGRSAKEAIIEAVDELSLPLTASYLTTLAGFIALMLGVSPSSVAQGTVLSIGITLIFVISALLIPVLLATFNSTYNLKPNPFFDAIKENLARIASYQAKRPKLVIAAVAAITVLMIGGASQVEFSTSNSNWIPPDDPVSLSFRGLTYDFGNTDSVTLILQAKDDDLRSIETVRELQELKAQLRGIPSIHTVDSPFSEVPLSTTEIQTRSEDSTFQAQFNEDFTVTTMTLRSEGFEVSDSGEAQILQELSSILNNADLDTVEVSPFGDVIRFQELGESLQQDTGVTTTIGLILVFIISSVVYFSITVGVTALLPVILAVVWAVGLMGFLGVPFTSLSTGLISLVLGIGIDFSIHLVDSIKRNFKELKDITESIRAGLTGSGAAILLSSITTLFGFLALSFSQLLGTRRFGWSLALSILAIFGVCILLVPAILSIQLRKQLRS